MNLTDNGIKEVLKVERVIKEDELYFNVDFIDWYGNPNKKRFQNIKNLMKKTWTE